MADAARRVIALRLEAVRDCIGRALRELENRRQNIHALRVATRRATALVAVYKTLAGGWSHALPGPQGEAVAQRHKSGDRPELDELGEMSGYNAATLKRPLY